VMSGVMALMMEESPTVMNVCPAKMKVKGRTLFKSAMPKNGNQSAGDRGSAKPSDKKIGNSVMAARATRTRTQVGGGNSLTATPAKKNAPPQSSDRSQSRAQSRRSRGFARGVMSQSDPAITLVRRGPTVRDDPPVYCARSRGRPSKKATKVALETSRTLVASAKSQRVGAG